MSHPDKRPSDLTNPDGSPAVSADQTEVIPFRPHEAEQEKVPAPLSARDKLEEHLPYLIAVREEPASVLTPERTFLGIPSGQPKTVTDESCAPLAEGAPA